MGDLDILIQCNLHQVNDTFMNEHIDPLLVQLYKANLSELAPY